MQAEKCGELWRAVYFLSFMGLFSSLNAAKDSGFTGEIRSCTRLCALYKNCSNLLLPSSIEGLELVLSGHFLRSLDSQRFTGARWVCALTSGPVSEGTANVLQPWLMHSSSHHAIRETSLCCDSIEFASGKYPHMEVNEINEFTKEMHEAGEGGMHHIALIISVLAVLVAMVTVLGHRTHTEAILMQSRAADQWNQYQAKKIRQGQIS